jgi:hypothetical protein
MFEDELIIPAWAKNEDDHVIMPATQIDRRSKH